MFGAGKETPKELQRAHKASAYSAMASGQGAHECVVAMVRVHLAVVSQQATSVSLTVIASIDP